MPDARGPQRVWWFRRLLVQLGRSQLDSTRTSSELRGENVEPLEESDAERAKEVVATG